MTFGSYECEKIESQVATSRVYSYKISLFKHAGIITGVRVF